MQFDAFLKQVCPPLDLDWRKYRRRSARHRLLERIAELGLTDFEEYRDRLREDVAEASGLAERMAVTVSRFFRDKSVWDNLQQRVLPQLLAAGSGHRYLRAWCVGCACGEEPYSLALLWQGRLQARHSRQRLCVLASDVDAVVLQRAREAVYKGSSLRELPADLRAKWFSARDNFWRLSPTVSRQVYFCRHNFMTEPPPATFDLIMARYLPFTYYRGARRLQSARRLWRALRPGGALMIGAKESLGAQERQFFVPWPGAAGVFRRRYPGGTSDSAAS